MKKALLWQGTYLAFTKYEIMFYWIFVFQHINDEVVKS